MVFSQNKYGKWNGKKLQEKSPCGTLNRKPPFDNGNGKQTERIWGKMMKKTVITQFRHQKGLSLAFDCTSLSDADERIACGR